MNDNLEFEAWFDYLANGMRLKNSHIIPSGTFDNVGFSLGGEYYSISHRDKNMSELYRVAEPRKVLATADFVTSTLFVNSKHLFWFGFDANHYTRTRERRDIICRLFRCESEFAFESEIRIIRPNPAPSPFEVVDLDPWSGNALCVDIRDEAGPHWYLFNFRTSVLAPARPADTFGLFLESDLLRSALGPLRRQ